MNTKQTFLFALIAISYSISTFFFPYPYSWVIKLIPMAILIFISFQHSESLADKLFLTGLLFSTVGDFFLGYDATNWFIFGLGSFLIAHLFYLSCFWPIERKNLVIALCYVIFGLIMFDIIAPGLGKLFVPVLMYMSILLIMGIFTVLSKKSNLWLVIGGLSFIASDSLLGVNKFYQPIPYANILIISTYYLAQYSLVKGIFLHRTK